MRTNIEIDDEHRQKLVGQDLAGIGWEGDLDAMRLARDMHDFDVVPVLGDAIALGRVLLHDDRDFEPMREYLGLQAA
jgi:hypothetical protein